VAFMIPSCGPAPTESRAEPLIYHLLKDQLSSDFTIIHSLPWLSAAAHEIAGNKKGITGEIDFLILHPVLGVLALEVKGGIHKVEGLAFVHVKSGTATRVIEQTRANVHGLARWLGVDPQLRLKIGYALAFPHSDFQGHVISSALVDTTVDPPETIVIDMSDVPSIGRRILEIMAYWKDALSTPALGARRMQALINALCPSFDGTPNWAARVDWDRQIWLRLTQEQSAVVNDAICGRRLVVTGWPGTGKTLILIECARRLLEQGKSVLVLTYNSLLCNHIKHQIGTNRRVMIRTWHSFCGQSNDGRSLQMIDVDRDWLDRRCLDDLQSNVEDRLVQDFDAVLIDEAQAFRTEWIQWLCHWHEDRQMLAFCDETQVFSFESGRVSLPTLCETVSKESAFTLTSVIRSPQAVFQRLRQVRQSTYQLHAPRELEIDSLDERLVVNMRESLYQTLLHLADSAVEPSDIAVLSKFGWEPELSSKSPIRFETLSRFRGMESPIVVVPSAEQMDDAELFCAYSRATTLCIALYDAEKLGIRGASGRFQTAVLSVPSNYQIADDARRSAQTDEIVRANVDIDWLNLESVSLGWSEEWRSWAVLLKDDMSLYWLDHLACEYQWPIYSWKPDSIREIYRSSPVDVTSNERPNRVSLLLTHCNQCSSLRPHRIERLNGQDTRYCAICEVPDAVSPYSLKECVISRVRALDNLLNPNGSRRVRDADRKLIPLLLAAGGAIRYARNHQKREILHFDSTSSDRISYHAAIGFVYSRINWLPAGRQLNVRNLAEETFHRYLIPNGLSLDNWKKDIALACSVAYKRGHLVKIEKGIYAPPSG
jgi:hypothetical protein